MNNKKIIGSITNTINNLAWLYKPYIKYGKSYVLLSLIFWCGVVPVARLVSVYLPSAIVNMLDAKVDILFIFLFVIVMQCLLMLQPMYEDIFNMFCKNQALTLIDAKLKRLVFEKAINTDMKYIDDPEYYDNYSWTIKQYANKANEAQRMVNRIASTIITIVAMLTIIATLSPLAVIVTILGTVIENLMFIATNRYEVAQEDEIVPYERRISYCHRVFYQSKYAMDLKSSGITHHLFEEFDNAQKEKIDIIKKYAFKKIPWSLAGNLTFYLARTFVILNIVYGIYAGNIETVGAYITMMVSVETLKNALNELFYYVKDANRLSLYTRKIRTFFDVTSTIETEDKKTMQLLSGPLGIQLCNVSFNYENSNFILDNISFDIKPGEKIAIVGENGVGKSTIVKLLMRFYDVISGAIYINGINIKEYDLQSLRRKIGVAFQHTNIYALSLYKNINVYDGNNENTITAIKKTGIDKLLDKNNASIDSELTREFDENGIMLSGGEIQKIGIARLLCGDFGLLIFDEPSAALDPIAEHEMSELILDSSNCSTTIIIAHRLSTIRNVDKIVLLDKGTVKEVGNHEELMQLKGKYYEMFTKQAENYVK